MKGLIFYGMGRLAVWFSNDHLPPDEIKRRRNGNYRNYRSHLDGVDPFTCRSFAQRRTANIDNSIAERSICPL